MDGPHVIRCKDVITRVVYAKEDGSNEFVVLLDWLNNAVNGSTTIFEEDKNLIQFEINLAWYLRKESPFLYNVWRLS